MHRPGRERKRLFRRPQPARAGASFFVPEWEYRPKPHGTPPALGPLAGLARAAAASQPGNFQPRNTPPPRPAPGAQNAPDRFSPAVIFPPLPPSGGGPPGPPPPLAQKGTPPPPPAFYKLLRGEREKTPPYDSGHFFAVAAQGAPSLVPLLVKGLKAEMTSSPL